MKSNFEELSEILQAEVKPALGCTGPIGISYVAAEARDAVGGTPIKIIIRADKDMCAKNDDVGIPGTSVFGLKMAAALGAFAGDAGAKLEVLKSITPEDERKAYDFSLSDNITIEPDWETEAIGVYMEAIVVTENGTGHAIVAKTHSNLVYKSANGKAIVDKNFDRCKSLDEKNDPITKYQLKDFYEFATEAPFEMISFLEEAVRMNRELAQAALDGKTGAGFGVSMLKRSKDNLIRKAKAITAAGSEARMAGYDLPTMTCATSGNVGITVSLPLSSVAEDLGKSKEEMLRALALGYLVTIYAKNHIGRHSAMCACVVAGSQGVASGTVLLMGGGVEQIQMAINNTIVNIFGVVCDGARLACAMKLASAAGTAIEGALLAMDGVKVPDDEGICGKTGQDSIDFMGKFAKTGMVLTDLLLCKALYAKHHDL